MPVVAGVVAPIEAAVVATAAARSQDEATEAARSRFEALAVARLQCAAVAMVMEVTGIVAVTARRRSARLLLVLLPQGPITAAAAVTTPTATIFARTGIEATQPNHCEKRRRAVVSWRST
jgi:hypothetical protein